MQYSIQKDGKFLTGNIQAGRYEFTEHYAFRYTFEESRARQIAGHFPGSSIVKEDWFDGNKAPFRVFRVDTDEEVLP